MVPKLHKKAYSFRGVARYVLGERDAPSSDRVAWTETVNLATRKADAAWRVMAATAMDQARLKREAGVKNTGRKSNLCVQHFTLSWHPEEAEGLTRKEMVRAATAMLRVMKAEDHQALIVAHDDQAHPHVHVLLNRVNPTDGRLLSSSFEKLKASRWAQKYEEERGKIYCEERVLNNEARDRGEYTRGDKDDPRALHDALQAAADEEARRQLREEHRQRSAELKAEEQLLSERTADTLSRLETEHHAKQAALLKEARKRIARSRDRVRERFRPLWRRLRHEHAAERRGHELREQRVLGRVQNAMRSIDFAALVGAGARRGRAPTIGEVFRLLSDSGAREQVLRNEHRSARDRLHRRQKRLEKLAVTRSRSRRDTVLAQTRRTFLTKRGDLLLRTSMQRAKLRARWLEKGRRLRTKLREFRRDRVRLDRKICALPDRRSATRGSDLLPPRNADAVARRMDQWREMRSRRGGRGLGRDRDDERER